MENSSDNLSDSEEIKADGSKPLNMTDEKAKKQKLKEMNQKMRDLKKARGEEVSEEEDDDDDGSLFDEDDSEEEKKVQPPKKAAPQAEASENYSDDEMELSLSPGKQPTPQPNKAKAVEKEPSIMDGSVDSKKFSKGGDQMDMNDLIDESIGSRDMLQSQTNQAFEFEHVEVKDPEHEKVDEEVKKTIEEIPSKFGQTAEKKKPAAATKARP